jgi:hypothetical protein
MLHAVCLVWHVACCHRSKQFPHVRMRARNVQAQTPLSVWPWPMRWSGAAYGARAPTQNGSRLPYIPCAAATPHPSLQSGVGLQLEQIAATGNAAEKALLADVTEKTSDASYVELLRLFKVRRSVADGHS